ncbi:MAG: class II histone deacetylase [Halolamina sp.]|uniref:class II histone deacetylase n=1 Tax=Halolamina sp. TaxID=1940283 RepID=UPI002FC39311
MGDPRVVAYWHDDCLAHEPPAGEFEYAWTGRLAAPEAHPDRRERVENIRSILTTELGTVAAVDWRDAPLASRLQLERAHDESYLDDLRAACAEAGPEGKRITPTTGINEHTYRAARRAAGGAVAAVETTTETDGDTVAYSCTRPSGHHAAPAVTDGFCFVNNAAVAAEHALAECGADRVVILDWDVHHGNGTQECFYDREDVLVVSIHNDHGAWDPETHPQTGGLEERGTEGGEGYTVNVPLPAGIGDPGYERLFDELVEPVVRAYDPDTVVASAGGDAGALDPLGRNLLTKAGFETIGRRVRALAADCTDGSLAAVQEGGYQPTHLAYAMLGTLEGMLTVETGVDDQFPLFEEDSELVADRIDDLVAAHGDYWPVA